MSARVTEKKSCLNPAPEGATASACAATQSAARVFHRDCVPDDDEDEDEEAHAAAAK